MNAKPSPSMITGAEMRALATHPAAVLEVVNGKRAIRLAEQPSVRHFVREVGVSRWSYEAPTRPAAARAEVLRIVAETLEECGVFGHEWHHVFDRAGECDCGKVVSL